MSKALRLDTKVSHSTLPRTEEYSIADVRLEITPETYRRKFLALLHFEEREHSRLLASNCDGRFSISPVSEEQLQHFQRKFHNAQYFYIVGMSPRQILYASQASKEAHIKCPSGTVEAEIIYHHDHQDADNTLLYISVSRLNGSASRLFKCLGRRRRAEFRIEFKVKHFYFSKLQESVQSISDETIRRIVPLKSDFKQGFRASRVPQSRFRYHQLDPFQYKALRTMVFSNTSAPIVVPGPFGSGKTRLLSVATEYFISSAERDGAVARVLLCCHHQNSADIFMSEYFLKMINNKENPFETTVVRVVSKVHHNSSRPQWQNQCNVAINDFNQNIHLYRSHDRIVMVTTYITSLDMCKSIGQDYFTHILIDEGAQAREPECIAPLSMAGSNTRIIIVGDDKQVGPKLLVLGEDAQDNGLGDSLLERLRSVYMEIPNARKSLSDLRNNYRCVPDILKLSSDLFYDSSLVPCTRSRPVRGKPFPLEFICSSVTQPPIGDCENPVEAEIIVSELRNLLFEREVRNYRICIISPSQRQVSLIHKLRKKHNLPWVKTLATYQVQGQEFDVLLLSTIESTYSDGRSFDPLKSLCHPAVFNTVITRARSLIIAVGNPHTLRKTENAIAAEGPSVGCWEAFITTCRDNSTYDDGRCGTISHPLKQRPPVTQNNALIGRGTTPFLNKTVPVKYEGMGHHANYTSHQKFSSGSTVPPLRVPVQTQQIPAGSSKPSNVTGVAVNNISKQQEYSLADTRLPLNVKNYKKKFGSLVLFEEKEHARLLAQYCDGEYELRSVSNDDVKSTWVGGVFHIRGLAPEQIVYASQACGNVFIKPPGKSFKASVLFDHCHYDNENEVLRVGVNEIDLQKLRGYLDHNGCGKFEMSFGVKHSYFNNLMKSIDSVGEEAIKRIIPMKDNFEEGLDLSRIPKSPFPTNQLDPHQFKALQTMVFSRSTAPVIVPGPFGSGKTRLLSVASEYFVNSAKTQGNNARILLCCHHQSSADIFMRDYFIPMLNNRENPLKADVIRVASQTYQKGRNTQSMIDFNTFESRKGFYLSKDCLIIVTTYLTALRMSEFIRPGFFTHILIDEGAQAREPECIAPLSMSDRNTRIIIAGDSKQVGPKLLVLGKVPQDNGLGESLLTRLQKRYYDKSIGEKAQSYCVTLLRNYRCVAKILELPSTLFYNSKLIPFAPALNIAVEYPLKFVCCKEVVEVAGQCESQHEAEIIVEELRSLVCGSNALPSNVQICIMFTSQTQGSLIRKLLRRESNPRMRSVKLLSTYQMQGQEFDVLILSTVEKISDDLKPFDPLKSICHPAVFNTAITRVRSLVIAIGYPSTLITSENAIGGVRCWKQYIDRCKTHNTYYENITDSIQGFKINRMEPTSLKNEEVSSSFKFTQQPKFIQNSFEKTKNAEKKSDELQKLPLDKASPSIIQSYEVSKSMSSAMMKPRSSKRGEHSMQKFKGFPDQQPTSKNQLKAESKAEKSSIQQNKTSSNKGRGKPVVNSYQDERSTDSMKVAKPLFLAKNFIEEFPLLEDSKKFSKAAVKMMKKVPGGVSVTRRKFTHDHQPRNQELLDEPLTRSNYRKKFHQLLCREEEEHTKLLEKRCDGEYEFRIYNHKFSPPEKEMFHDAKRKKYARFGYITADHLDEDKLAYAKQASKNKAIVGFSSDIDGSTIELELDMVGSSSSKQHQVKIYLGFEASDEAFFSKGDGIVSSNAKVTFILKYSYFDRLHDGLDAISEDVINKLMPIEEEEFSLLQLDELKLPLHRSLSNFITLDFKDKTITNPQMFALRTIMKADPLKAPILIAGSFGTGKTRLIARSAYQILQKDNTRVLVCAHHQKSLDSFVENYFGQMFEKGWRFRGSLVRLIPNKHYKISNEKYKKFYRTIHSMITSKNLPKEKLRLVLSTYSSAHRLFDYLGRNHFTHMLLDEGAQCREPETIIPLSLANKNTTVVIAGDHKQVGPSMLVLGEEARKYELKYSLLERLHRLFHDKKLTKTSEQHCVTLLTNFRSHHALLSLPSYLFYNSALVTVSEASHTKLHPDAPYPLKFVCSSLDDIVVEETNSRNEDEMRLILDEVKKYIQNWPPEWECLYGNSDDPKLCIMATTPNQKVAFFDEIRNNRKYEEIKKIDYEVLTVYDIQGREFRAIFLSTAEPIDSLGISKNPTKSPCDQFVFNTAITRAKSLVVCAGNPFLLMKVENNMDNIDNSFWKDYLRRCITTKSFIVPPTVRKTADAETTLLDKLYRKVFVDDSKINSEHQALSSPQPQSDSIMKVLEESLAKRYNFQKCKLRIKQQKDEYQNNWEVIAEETRNKIADSDFAEDDARDSVKIKCDLEIKTRSRAIAIPQESPQDSIIINGYHRRQGAFSGDVVEVTFLGSDKKYGRVTNVKEFHHPMKYICEADSRNVIFFNPTDRTVPSIVNLPKISRSILQYKQEELNELQRNYITVFEESSLDDDDKLSLKIKELVPVDMTSSLLFVVKVLSWSPRFRMPLGAVVEALPRTNNSFLTEKLLLITHDIQHNEEEYTAVNDEETQAINPSPSISSSTARIYHNALTIDPDKAINFDDALTIVPIDDEPNTCELSVLIIDVAECIRKDSEWDKVAQRHGTSVYPGNQVDCRTLHMLPSAFTKSKLTLSSNGEKRPVIAVSTRIKLSDNGHDVVEVAKKGVISEALLQNPVNLTYSESQCIMKGKLDSTELRRLAKEFDASNKISLMRTMNLLFKVAMKIRINRLQDAAFNYRITEPEEEKNWQTHLLVEELMVWANHSIAEYMIEERPDVAVVRSQPPPLSIELDEFRDTHSQFLDFSLSHKSYLPSGDDASPSIAAGNGLMVTGDVVKKLQLAYKSNDLEMVARILSLECNFSQLAMLEDALISISRKAKYTFINPSEEELKGKHHIYHHYSLRQLYTHFSSPIRRYIDIIVQRIVKALVEKKEMPYSEEDLKSICRSLNLKMLNSNRYSKDIDQAHEAFRLEEKGMEEAMAFVVSSMQKRTHNLHLCFPDGRISKFMSKDNSSFDYSELNYHKRDSSTITWEVTAVPLNGQFLNKCQSLVKSSDDDDDEIMKVNLYPALADEDTGRCCSEYKLHIVSDNKVIQLGTWKLAQDCVKEPSKEKIDCFMSSFLPTVAPSLEESGGNDISTGVKLPASPLVHYTVRKKLGVGYPVKAWIGTSTRRAISSPSLHMIEVAPTLRICLKHVQNPSACFSNRQLKVASKSFESLVDYVDAWCNALLAEACHDGVMTKKMVFLKAVPLMWPPLLQSEVSIDRIYYSPQSALTLEIPLKKYDMMDFIDITVGDLVCARYEIVQNQETLNEVYHFYVSSVKKPGGDKKEKMKSDSDVMTVSFRSYGEKGCRVSRSMEKFLKLQQPPLCDLQIIKMSVSFSRVFQRLQSLKTQELQQQSQELPELQSQKQTNTQLIKLAEPQHPWMDLAKDIASGRGISNEPDLCKEYIEVFKKDSNARSLWEPGPLSSPPGKRGQLNDTQWGAIEAALHNKFQLIQGPPGTGKSVTGAHLAYIFATTNIKTKNRKCVLYCGPSNKAVDVVHYQLIKVNQQLKRKLKIIRLYGRAHEQKDFPNPIMEVMKMNTLDEQIDSICPADLKEYALHYKIRDLPVLNDMEEKLLALKRDGKIPSSTERLEYKKCLSKCESTELQNSYDIILCTCNETCSVRLLSACKKDTDDEPLIAQCIVDECGMATEPETIAAISRCDHAVLIGDHMQLQPVVKHTPAKACGLSRSLFQRYAEDYKDQDTLVVLEVQYRMHSYICEAPSNLFYQSRLEPAPSVLSREPLGKLEEYFRNCHKHRPKSHHGSHPGNYPVLFYDIEGEEESGMANEGVHKSNVDAHSKSNQKEALECVKVIKDLMNKYAIQPRSIAVLTPYSAQKSKITELLEKEKMKKGIKVMSIVESQGDEYDVVIISTVRTLPRKQIRDKKYVLPDHRWKRENLGFLMDSHQLNVAITRARHGLIIIGDCVLLEYDDTWKQLIEKYRKDQLIIHK